MSIFGDRLKDLRISNGMMQAELAQKLEISPRTISFLENGQREPNLDTILKISTFFDCSIDYLLGRDSTISFEDTISPPMVEGIKDGELIFSDDVDTIPIPAHYLKGSEGFLITVADDSMIEVGVFEGDVLIAVFEDTITSGSISIIVIDNNELLVRTIQEELGLYMVIPENSSMRPRLVEPERLKMFGKVVGIFRHINQ